MDIMHAVGVQFLTLFCRPFDTELLGVIVGLALHQNGTQVPDHTDWHNVILWRRLAEITEKYVHKGDKLYIEGRIRYTTYDDKQGQRRYATEIWADNIELLSPRPAANTSVNEALEAPLPDSKPGEPLPF